MQPGELLGGRYRLGDPLGRGGMSVVWRAHDDILGREVAVKALAPSLAANPDALALVRAEAMAAARLRHPNIVGVHDYGEVRLADGPSIPYVVMELVEGTSLAAVLDHGPLAWPVAVRVCADVAAALAAAHERGIVHRDITPGNVMLPRSGATLVDFGISAAVGDADTAADGSLLGTPAYLAPERLDRGPVQPATDVYALGLLLYKALTGRLPWRSATSTQMLTAHRYVDPTPLPPISGLPAAVTDACHRCLAKRPEDRPTSAELAGELAGYAAGGAATPPAGWLGCTPATTDGLTGVRQRLTAVMPPPDPTPPSRRRTAARLTAVGLVLVAAVTGAIAGTNPPGPGDQPDVVAAGVDSPPLECGVRYELRRLWPGGFTAAITVMNRGSAAADPWLLEFTFPADQRVIGAARGAWQQSGARVSVNGGALPAGGTLDLTFDGAYQAANPVPIDFWLNGSRCASTPTAAAASPSPAVQDGGPGGGGEPEPEKKRGGKGSGDSGGD